MQHDRDFVQRIINRSGCSVHGGIGSDHDRGNGTAGTEKGEKKKVKAYKGFNKNLQCNPTGENPFQYEIGKTYEEPEADLCNSGFHACENPLDVFSYYSPSDSRYC